MAASLRGGGGGGGSSTATNSPVGDWTHISDHKIAATAIGPVCVALSPLMRRWKELGKELGVPNLGSINGSDEKCLSVVVEKWLTTGTATWRVLVTAVHSIDPSVATSIASKHVHISDEKEKLTEKPDLNDVMNIVAAKIPSKWETVGSQLGITKGELDGIAKKRQDDGIECWRDVIVIWRNKASTTYPYCWSTIIEALKSSGVDEKDLADEYCTELQELHKQNTDYAGKGDVKITSSDHKDVMNKVGVNAKDNWKALGSELGLSIPQLNSIEMQRRNDPQNCISDAINKWRASMSKTPITWQTLLVSLCKPQVGLKYLADDIYADPNFPFKKT